MYLQLPLSDGVVDFVLTILDVFKKARFVGTFGGGPEMTLSQLLSPCVFGHGDLLRTRDAEGHLALECADCGHVRRILQEPAIRGPKHRTHPVAGAPALTVKKLRVLDRRYPRPA
jgi:hypothetical protein